MKIAILTLFNDNYNYGGFLQAYALASVLNKMDFVACQIKVNGGKNLIYTSRLSQCRQYSFLEVISKIKERLTERKTFRIEGVINERKRLFDLFESENIPVGKCTYNLETIDLLGKDYDAFVVGSDQIWNPNVLNRFFALDFEVGDDGKKIAYAASIGRGALSDYEGACLKKYLEKFDSISVRELSAKNLLITAGIKNKIDVVLDPTMLINPQDWDAVCRERMIEERYVLLYAFSCCPFQDELKHYYESKGYKVVYIPYVKQKYNGFDFKSPLEPIWNVGPAEFLSLIKYADAVVTDSFHGAVFSIIYNRRFFVFNRDKSQAKTSKNARLSDLLTTFNLSHRMVYSTEDIINGSRDIDFNHVNDTRKILREQSLQWLKRVITLKP